MPLNRWLIAAYRSLLDIVLRIPKLTPALAAVALVASRPGCATAPGCSCAPAAPARRTPWRAGRFSGRRAWRGASRSRFSGLQPEAFRTQENGFPASAGRAPAPAVPGTRKAWRDSRRIRDPGLWPCHYRGKKTSRSVTSACFSTCWMSRRRAGRLHGCTSKSLSAPGIQARRAGCKGQRCASTAT